jgi:hypothetical protein
LSEGDAVRGNQNADWQNATVDFEKNDVFQEIFHFKNKSTNST